MALSIEDGLFWFCLTARKSFMFDEIYWMFLDEWYFEPLSSLDDRLSLLTQMKCIKWRILFRQKCSRKRKGGWMNTKHLMKYLTYSLWNWGRPGQILLSLPQQSSSVVANSCYLCRHPARIRGGRRKFLTWKTQHSYCDNIIRQLENLRKDAAWGYSWWWWWILFTLTYLFPRGRCRLVFVHLFSKSTSPGVIVFWGFRNTARSDRILILLWKEILRTLIMIN